MTEVGIVGAGLAVFGPGCTSSADDGPAGAGSSAQSGRLELVRLFSTDGVTAAGIEQRLPFGLLDNGSVAVAETAIVTARIMFGDRLVNEVQVPSRLVAHDHPTDSPAEGHQHSDIARYFPLRTTLPEPGIYDIIVMIGDEEVSVPVQAFDPADISVILPGAAFPALDTPTIAAPGAVEQICTKFDGPCAFHTRTVADVLAAAEPMAFLIASPAYCATAYCGPVLDVLIEAAPNFPSVVPVHLEVYENTNEVNGNIADPDIRPMKEFAQLGLEFEPALFLVDRSGTLVERIDNIFDRSELEVALAAIA